MKILTVHNRRLDLAQLVRVATQARQIKVKPAQLILTHMDDTPMLIVVAAENDRYEVLAGRPQRDVQEMPAKLMSTILLKKAQVVEPEPSRDYGTQPFSRPAYPGHLANLANHFNERRR